MVLLIWKYYMYSMNYTNRENRMYSFKRRMP